MSDIEVKGNGNQVAGRDFNENVVNLPRVGNINLGGTQVNINSAPAPDLLSPEQRRRLNRLVTEISNEYQADPRLIWKEVVHTRTGVSSVEDIPRDKFAEAEQALLDHAEHLHAQAHARCLRDEVAGVAKRRGITAQMEQFCSREFGCTVLTKLSPVQLKAVLRFVDTYQVPAEQQAAPLSWPGFHKLMMNHPGISLRCLCWGRWWDVSFDQEG